MGEELKSDPGEIRFAPHFREFHWVKKVGRSEGKKVSLKMNIERRMKNNKGKSKFDIQIKNTRDLIEKIQNNEMPDKMIPEK